MTVWCDEYQLYGRSLRVSVGDHVSWPVRDHVRDVDPVFPDGEDADVVLGVEFYFHPASVIVGRVDGVIARIEFLTWRVELGEVDGGPAWLPVPGSGSAEVFGRAPVPFDAATNNGTCAYLVRLEEAQFDGAWRPPPEEW